MQICRSMASVEREFHRAGWHSGTCDAGQATPVGPHGHDISQVSHGLD